MREELMLDGPAGPLEALLECESDPPFTRAAVVCHPHPLHGGTMHTTVVHRMAKGMRKAGFATLRFNFRGVGRSGGTHDEGRGEQEDVRAALDALRREPWVGPVGLRHLYMAGFSFGSRVGLEVGAADPDVEALIGVGLPLLKYDFDFLASSPKPKLLLLGDRDEFVPASNFVTFAESCNPPIDFDVIEDSDHLFSRRAHLVEQAISSWLLDRGFRP